MSCAPRIAIGLGAGIGFNPIPLAAMSGVEPTEAGRPGDRGGRRLSGGQSSTIVSTPEGAASASTVRRAASSTWTRGGDGACSWYVPGP